LRTRPLQGQHECDTPSIAKAGRTWDPLTVPMSAASLPAPLDPVENISTLDHPEWSSERPRPRGYYHEEYLHAARRDGWGEPGSSCGAGVIVRRDGEQTTVRPILCDRWSCALCGPRRAAWLKRQITRTVEGEGLTHFWTLTLRRYGDEALTPAESVAQFERIQACWNRARLALSRRAKRAGIELKYVWVIETTKAGMPHLHLLTNYDPGRSVLSAVWMRATGDSWVTDDEPIRDEGNAANYIAKYCTEQATIRRQAAWADLRHKHNFGKSQNIAFEAFRAKAERTEVDEQTGELVTAWERIDVPYWTYVAQLKGRLRPVVERVLGTPSIVLQNASQALSGPQAAQESPSAAPAGLSCHGNTPCFPPDPVFLRDAKDALLRVLHGGHTGPPRREKMAASVPSWMGGVPLAHPPDAGSTHVPQDEKGGA